MSTVVYAGVYVYCSNDTHTHRHTHTHTLIVRPRIHTPLNTHMVGQTLSYPTTNTLDATSSFSNASPSVDTSKLSRLKD